MAWNHAGSASRARKFGAAFLFTALGLGCPRTPVAVDRSIAANVLELMECQECNGGERDTVIQHGDLAVSVLRDFLLKGPTPERISQVRAALDAVLSHRIGASPNAVQLQLDDFAALYRVRSAGALGEIRGRAAQDALCSARRQNFARAEVRAAIDAALARGVRSCP